RIMPILTLWTLVSFHALSQITPERFLADLITMNSRGDFPGFGWTVLIELQMYLVFPFLVRFRRRYGPMYLVGLVAVLVAIRAHLWVLTHNVQTVSYFTVIGRADQFLLGMLAFDVSRRWSKQLGTPAVFAVLLVLWCLIMHGFNRLGG